MSNITFNSKSWQHFFHALISTKMLTKIWREAAKLQSHQVCMSRKCGRRLTLHCTLSSRRSRRRRSQRSETPGSKRV